MRTLSPRFGVLLAALLAGGCGSAGSTAASDLLAPADLAPPDKASLCAATFGTELTAAFGRLDGTVLAVVPPGDPRCPRPNSTHLVLQVTMHGAAYRMVLNVQSDRAGVDSRVRFAEFEAPLPGAPWSDGWHAGEALDYVGTLGAHAAAFAPHPSEELVAMVTDRIAIGEAVSVYATSSGGDSAHLIHRNTPGADGAIVRAPLSAHPGFLLFAFDQQAF